EQQGLGDHAQFRGREHMVALEQLVPELRALAFDAGGLLPLAGLHGRGERVAKRIEALMDAFQRQRVHQPCSAPAGIACPALRISFSRWLTSSTISTPFSMLPRV